MDKLVVLGGRPLRGQLHVGGSKNTALPLMAAAVLADGPTTIHNIPALKLHIRMGYHEQGRVTHVYCLFGRWKFFRETRYEGSRLDPLRKPGRPTVSAAAGA